MAITRVAYRHFSTLFYSPFERGKSTMRISIITISAAVLAAVVVQVPSARAAPDPVTTGARIILYPTPTASEKYEQQKLREQREADAKRAADSIKTGR
jgi:hypothetical protein